MRQGAERRRGGLFGSIFAAQGNANGCRYEGAVAQNIERGPVGRGGDILQMNYSGI